MEPWRVYSPVFADSHHLNEKQDLDLHKSNNSDPDPHLSEKRAWVRNYEMLIRNPEFVIRSCESGSRTCYVSYNGVPTVPVWQLVSYGTVPVKKDKLL
jgi:hypothetical protein